MRIKVCITLRSEDPWMTIDWRPIRPMSIFPRIESEMKTLSSILHGKCPACRQGAIFRGWMAVHDRCPQCGILFQRESGYFVGAMYIAYGLAGGLLATFTALLRYAVPMRLKPAMVTATLLFLPLVPFIVRWSRILWIYFDRAVDPLD